MAAIKPYIKIRFLFLLTLLLTAMSSAQEVFDKENLMGKSDISFYGDGTYQLRKEAYEAFLKMKKSAATAGIEIKVVSSYRSFEHQNSIWTRKYNRFTAAGMSPTNAINKIIEYSTIPGTSRHHWGTDLDIVDGKPKQPKDVLLSKHFEGNGPYCKFKEWMDQNAASFGFYLVYTNNPERKGFKYEPWHYSYAPLSKPMLTAYQKINLKEALAQLDLIGAKHIDANFIEKYVNFNILDINPELKN
ncbi:M15 family metallopeptidase [Aquimarina intermedia]|uniref:D-alanyl-D-alanine carboxypeptidase-like protein n=1 Tax=Aquimarina intermedia TaxID=350814 RepID=A0A5S5BRS7_9FLAO|nr:M15 family metallopeptidase [Aquimarina intermedia]TYP69891.1 D-alanyl-D-alanine carboxypeptidase-like protein [Aquimarina intermedia]